MIKTIKLIDKQNHTILYSGIAEVTELKNNGMEYKFGDGERNYTWKVWKNGMMIRSEADYILELTLRLNNTTKGHIETEFGILDLKCKASLYKINEKCIEIRYILNEDHEQLFHFLLEIGKEEYYAIH